MLDLLANWDFLQDTPFFMAALLVTLASLLGSPHCAGMCGPLVATVTSDQPKRAFFYHVGRLLGYLIIGSLFGWLGKTFLNSQLQLVNKISAVVVSIMFVYLGIKTIRGQGMKLGKSWAAVVLKRLPEKLKGSAFTFGLLTPLLPCAWLYGFVMASFISQSPIKAASLMIFFWLGTLPALLTIQVFFKKISQLKIPKLNYVFGVLFILVGLYTVTLKFKHANHGTSSEQQHHHHH